MEEDHPSSDNNQNMELNAFSHDLNSQLHQRQEWQQHQQIYPNQFFVPSQQRNCPSSDSFNNFAFAAQAQNQTQPFNVAATNAATNVSCAAANASAGYIGSHRNKRSFSRVEDDENDSMKCGNNDDGFMSDVNVNELSFKRLRVVHGSDHNIHMHEDRNTQKIHFEPRSNFASFSSAVPSIPTSTDKTESALTPTVSQRHSHDLSSLPIRTCTALPSKKRPYSVVGTDADAVASINGRIVPRPLSTVSIDDLESSSSRDEISGGGRQIHANLAKLDEMSTGAERNRNFNHVLGNLHLERERRARMVGAREVQSHLKVVANPVIESQSKPRHIPNRRVRLQSHSNLG